MNQTPPRRPYAGALSARLLPVLLLTTLLAGAAAAPANPFEADYLRLLEDLDAEPVICDEIDPYAEFPRHAVCFLARARDERVRLTVDDLFDALTETEETAPTWTRSWLLEDGLPRRPFDLDGSGHILMLVPSGAETLIVVAPTNGF